MVSDALSQIISALQFAWGGLIFFCHYVLHYWHTTPGHKHLLHIGGKSFLRSHLNLYAKAWFKKEFFWLTISFKVERFSKVNYLISYEFKSDFMKRFCLYVGLLSSRLINNHMLRFVTQPNMGDAKHIVLHKDWQTLIKKSIYRNSNKFHVKCKFKT